MSEKVKTLEEQDLSVYMVQVKKWQIISYSATLCYFAYSEKEHCKLPLWLMRHLETFPSKILRGGISCWNDDRCISVRNILFYNISNVSFHKFPHLSGNINHLAHMESFQNDKDRHAGKSNTPLTTNTHHLLRETHCTPLRPKSSP